MQNKYIKKLMEGYPHVIDKGVMYMLSKVVTELSPGILQLSNEEYIHLIRFGLQCEGKINYKQVAAMLNNFHQLSFRAFLDNGFTLKDYEQASAHVQRHIILWNKDLKPLLEELNREQQVSQMRKSGFLISKGEA